MKKNLIKETFIKSLPVMAGYIVLGTGFGILLKVNGYGLFWSIAMSTFIYAGSMQYVTIDLLSNGANILVIALTALAVNARHLFYGLSMINKYNCKGFKKAYLIFSLTDETYSLLCNEDKRENDYYFFVSLFDQIYWVLGSALGSLIATYINFNSNGIEFSMTALFVVVVVEQFLSTKNHLASLIGLVSSAFALLVFGKEGFLIPTMFFIILLLLLFKKQIKEKEDV